MSDHYFAADPSSRVRESEITVDVWGREVRLTTASGVFSHRKLDPGTAVLFRQTEPPTVGERFLDLGCGYGVIGCALALARPDARVWAVDVNERALDLTRRNAQRLGIADRVTAALPDALPSDVDFDAIWSNPPIRVGKTALHELLLRWLPRLAPFGAATMVVGKNLGADSLQRWLREQGYGCDRLGSAKGFRVLRVVPPAAT
ncbi:MAG TPA: methyltransferase [Nocardioidaceae bacterium]|nr:methyltransferase [Nocardioidaceae bacterium]